MQDAIKEPTTIAAHCSPAISVVFCPDTRSLVSTGVDKMVRLWSLGSREAMAILRGHPKKLTDVTLTPEGRWLAMVG